MTNPTINIYNEDCLPAMKEMRDNEFDLCVTDPPYGVNFVYNTYKDSESAWFDLMNKFIPEIRRISKMVIFPSCQINKLGWFYANYPPDWLMAWYKGSPGHSAYIGFNDWEPLMVYGKTKSNLYMHDFIQQQPEKDKSVHPCPKPINWSKKIMKNALPDGGQVIDPFLGSGSTAIACHDMGFDLTAYEIDREYYEAAVKRLNEHKRQLKLF